MKKPLVYRLPPEKTMNDNSFELLIFLVRILGVLIAPLILALAGVLIFLNISKNRKRRAADIRNFSAETGLTYVGADSYQSIPGYGYFRLFNLGNGHGRQIENAFKGTIDGYRLSVFDYIYYETFSKQKIRRQTVAMISSPRIKLPWFSLMPQGKGLLQQVQNSLNPDINFPSNPQFSGNYLLLSQDEAGVRQVFHPGVLAYFEASGGGGGNFVIEAGGNTILFYRHGILAAPNQLRWMVDECLKTAKVFAR